MLKPTKKGSGTTVRERHLSRLSENTFFGLWSFPNVYTDEGFPKTGIGKELCDLLVVFNNKIIVFSDKDISFNSDIEVLVAWKRWFKRSIIKSAKQLLGAESWLKSYPNRIYLDKDCRHKFPIDLSKIEYEIHLVAVTCNTEKPAEDFFKGGSSGTLFQIYPLEAKDCLEKPFVVGDLFPKNTFVHVFDEISLDLLLQELNTISDFIGYLAEKERVIREGEILQSAGEEELLAYYFRGRGPSNTSGRMIYPTECRGNNGPISLAEGLWLEYVQEEEYAIWSHMYQESLLWDRLIERFSHHILQGTVGRGADKDFDYHERAVRHLASENRYSRFLLAKAFKDKFLEVPKDRRSGRVVFSPNQKEKVYIFLFLPRYDNEDYQQYRDDRSHYVEAYALVAKFRFPRVKKVVVIATEPIDAKGRSEDIVSIEFEEDLTSEAVAEAKRLMADERILDDVSLHREKPFRPNARTPQRNKKAKYGRNEKCPCGSGKKYKKCCM
ncbi:YecA family protein [Marinobacter salarius]|uniref:YecA family protein n=1 Tax=Marinobacter salarius TaxID=1420917 RepID=UPI0012576003|nr:SEC-C metal-binding domain-containing protein [Marinobacter salarius]VVT24345.1 Preprotein translocase subunit SecA [Marinobacter salarius]VXB61004.1 conserved hypothetical protein [Marinobacter salarius]